MSGPGASELMRSNGLLVDGPAVWGSPVAGRGPGVFVVELPNAPNEAPIDHDTVRRWLERVPELTVDGEVPAIRQLAKRLGDFWLPGASILFVGRARTLGARVAAMYATPLGDARPYSGGYWLKALSRLGQLRIWWSQTDAPEEYEDALLAQFAASLPEAVIAGLPDPSVVLPFANLTTTSGARKQHGIENALREPAVAPVAAPAAGRGATRASPSRARSTATTPRLPRAPKAAAAPPPPPPSYVSAAGLTELTTELENLRNVVRPVVIERVKLARELGDLRENSEYESARREQSFVEGRIQALDALLRTAVVVEGGGEGSVVSVGSSVVVEIDGEQTTWQIVGSNEADPAAGKISYASPVGQSLLGKRAGDDVVAQLPRGQLHVRLREVR
jgi:transcription elongation factor GreA